MVAFESFSAAARIELQIPVDVTTFGGIARIAGELRRIETERRRSPLPPPKPGQLPRGRGHRLLSFEVHSPPSVRVLADPSWLSVYIGLLGLGVACLQLLGSYGEIKRGARDMAHDVGRLMQHARSEVAQATHALPQLTAPQAQELSSGAMLYLESAMHSPQDRQQLLVRAAGFASAVCRRDEQPTVSMPEAFAAHRPG